MHEIQCPNKVKLLPTDKTLFIGGGISGCPNWQKDMLDLLTEVKGIAFNPRRNNFDVSNPDIADEQLAWEYEHLDAAQAILFWFPMESICPITLLELGERYRDPEKLIFVGVHPKYPRRYDIEKRIERYRPDLRIHYSLVSMAAYIASGIA